MTSNQILGLCYMAALQAEKEERRWTKYASTTKSLLGVVPEPSAEWKAMQRWRKNAWLFLKKAMNDNSGNGYSPPIRKPTQQEVDDSIRAQGHDPNQVNWYGAGWFAPPGGAPAKLPVNASRLDKIVLTYINALRQGNNDASYNTSRRSPLGWAAHPIDTSRALAGLLVGGIRDAEYGISKPLDNKITQFYGFTGNQKDYDGNLTSIYEVDPAKSKEEYEGATSYNPKRNETSVFTNPSRIEEIAKEIGIPAELFYAETVGHEAEGHAKGNANGEIIYTIPNRMADEYNAHLAGLRGTVGYQQAHNAAISPAFLVNQLAGANARMGEGMASGEYYNTKPLTQKQFQELPPQLQRYFDIPAADADSKNYGQYFNHLRYKEDMTKPSTQNVPVKRRPVQTHR